MPIDDLMKCDYCGKGFMPKRSWQKYCSTKCRMLKFYTSQAARDPTDALTPQTGPTPAQEAEWQRRKDMAAEQAKAPRAISDPHLEEVVNKAADKLVVKEAEEKISTLLKNLGYGKKD